MKNRKLGATASYKNCGVTPSVDGIRIRGSASIMGTVGRELANFINPDLTWNPLAKGYRSAARRTRKPVASSFTVEMKPSDEETQKVGDMVVSDSEKVNITLRFVL